MAQEQAGDRLPSSSYDLIRHLDREFPARCLGEREDVVAAHRYAGLRSLVDALVGAMNDEISTITEQAETLPASWRPSPDATPT